MYLVITNTGNFGSLPDAAYCAAVRDNFGLTMPVLFDANGVFPGHTGTGTKDEHIVLDETGTIVHTSGSQSQAFGAINNLLQ